MRSAGQTLHIYIYLYLIHVHGAICTCIYFFRMYYSCNEAMQILVFILHVQREKLIILDNVYFKKMSFSSFELDKRRCLFKTMPAFENSLSMGAQLHGMDSNCKANLDNGVMFRSTQNLIRSILGCLQFQNPYQGVITIRLISNIAKI